jgi:aminopeptidase N
MRIPLAIQALGLLFGVAKAAPSPEVVDESRQLVHRAATCNTPTNRACWTTGFDINTDYESKVPRTGVTRRYTFNINEHHNWMGPDGHVKEVAMLVNSQYPGPTINAGKRESAFPREETVLD